MIFNSYLIFFDIRLLKRALRMVVHDEQAHNKNSHASKRNQKKRVSGDFFHNGRLRSCRGCLGIFTRLSSQKFRKVKENVRIILHDHLFICAIIENLFEKAGKFLLQHR